MPFAYIPKSLANTSCSAPVTDIYICAYEPNAVSGLPEPGTSIRGPMTNHWVMYFVTSSTGSFCFDPSPVVQEIPLISLSVARAMPISSAL